MAPEIGEYAKCAVCLLVVILDGGRDYSAGNPLVRTVDELLFGSRIGSVEMGDVGINVCIPVRCEVVGKFQVSSVLLETHIGTVVVGTAVLPSHHRRELALSDGVRRLAGDGAV